MTDRSYVEENETSRAELAELISRLDERAFRTAVGSWTVATSLCHLAFWDQRALFLLQEWESAGKIEPSPLSPQSVQAINRAVNAIAQAVPGPAAAQLARDSASAVDSHLKQIGDAFVAQLVSAGCERYLRRSLHRREHIRKIEEALEGRG